MDVQRVYDYRLFCSSCDSTLDVRACDEADAHRVGRARGWKVVPKFGITCPLCADHQNRQIKGESA